jgi:hypothetical protein
VVVANLSRHGRVCHQGDVRGLCALQTSYARPHFRAFLTEPTESVVARFVHHSCRQGNESLALVGEGNPASGPVQQAGVQMPLQRADLSRDGGLRASALLRGGRKRAGLRDPQKRLKRRDQIPC